MKKKIFFLLAAIMLILSHYPSYSLANPTGHTITTMVDDSENDYPYIKAPREN